MFPTEDQETEQQTSLEKDGVELGWPAGLNVHRSDGLSAGFVAPRSETFFFTREKTRNSAM